MGQCIACGDASPLIAAALSVCGRCARERFPSVRQHVSEVHDRARDAFGLPVRPPDDPAGIECLGCANACRIPDGEIGYCGSRENVAGGMRGAARGALTWYHDPLPTNCVADWVCPGGTGAGFPRFAHRDGPETGYRNLAVFYESCTFDCLFCQNWQFRGADLDADRTSAEQLAEHADVSTSCICFFGGDPTPQLPHALRAARRALAARGDDEILRICWETNGSMDPVLLYEMARLSLVSGGCVKFDLKAFDEGLHRALTGADNRRTLQNFTRVAHLAEARPDPPLLVASTLLVPGYVDEDEVRAIARFIASLDPDIPYSLLGFQPAFLMEDLPVTSRRHALACKTAAEAEGLTRVHIGNPNILGEAY
jgi:pyruvate formate lyase activating enzyme